jgi:hypothetical protein
MKRKRNSISPDWSKDTEGDPVEESFERHSAFPQVLIAIQRQTRDNQALKLREGRQQYVWKELRRLSCTICDVQAEAKKEIFEILDRAYPGYDRLRLAIEAEDWEQAKELIRAMNTLEK